MEMTSGKDVDEVVQDVAQFVVDVGLFKVDLACFPEAVERLPML